MSLEAPVSHANKITIFTLLLHFHKLIVNLMLCRNGLSRYTVVIASSFFVGLWWINLQHVSVACEFFCFWFDVSQTENRVLNQIHRWDVFGNLRRSYVTLIHFYFVVIFGQKFLVTAANVCATVVDLHSVLIRSTWFATVAFDVHDDSEWSKFTKWCKRIEVFSTSVDIANQNCQFSN